MVEADPLSQIYSALWALAEGSALVTSQIRLSDRIHNDAQSQSPQAKREAQASDLPELTLWVRQIQSNVGRGWGNSDKYLHLTQYDWLLKTSDPSAIDSVLPVMFAVYAAMTPWPGVAKTLTWNEQFFVKRVDLAPAVFKPGETEKERALAGWDSVWTCEIETWYET